MSRIASDTQFIEETLANVIKVDEFTRNLLDISRYVQREGLAQPAQSCINRADYMMDRFHTDGIGWSDRIRQVEVNTIASGLSSQSFKAHQMHDYLLNKYQIKLNRCSIPDNDSFRAVAQGLIDGFDAYGRIGCYILLVAEEMSLNFADHLSIELTVHETRPDIKFVRVRFIDLPPITKLGPNKELLLDRGAGTPRNCSSLLPFLLRSEQLLFRCSMGDPSSPREIAGHQMSIDKLSPSRCKEISTSSR